MLGKEATLRKTMLDECKGDKFEEVINVFAMAVLRKEAPRKLQSSVHARSCRTETLTQPENLSAEQRERLVPLIIAHRRVMQRQLSERCRLSEEFSERKRQVDDHAGRLAEKHKAILAREGQVPVIEPEELVSISDQVRSAWTGSEEWLRTLIHGGPSEMDAFRTETSLHVGNHPVFRTTDHLCLQSPSKSLLAELNRKVEKHQSRLQKWAEFRASLEKSQMVKRTEDLGQDREPILKFDMHQKLQPAVQKETTSLSLDRAMNIELIEVMRSELTSLGKPRSLPTHFPNVVGGRVHASNENSNVDERDKTEISVSTITRPLETLAINRVASTDDTSIIQELPSHENSPMAIPKPPNSSLAIKSDLEDSILNSFCSLSDQLSTNDLSDHKTHDPYTNTDRPSQSSLPSVSAEFSLPARPHQANDLANSAATRSANSDIESLTKLPPSSAPQPRTASLLERTRQSMGLLPNSSSPDHSNHNLYYAALKKQVVQPQKRQNLKPGRPSSQILPINPFSSTPHQNPRQFDQPIHPLSKHHSEPFPRAHVLGTTTATATPKSTPTATDENNHNNKNKSRAREPTLPPHHGPDPDSSPTSSPPRDDLFSDQADYESVFKSRPRVALSPPIGTPTPSPERRSMGGRDRSDGRIAEGNSEDSEDENEQQSGRWDSSPTTRNRTGRR